jgi:hypothetical protein
MPIMQVALSISMDFMKTLEGFSSLNDDCGVPNP